MIEDPEDDGGDKVVCYVEPTDGEKLSEKVVP